MILAAHSLAGMLSPEILLLIGAVVLLVGGLARRPEWRFPVAALIVIVAAFVSAIRLGADQLDASTPSEFTAGPLVFYVRLVTLALGILIVLANRHVPIDGERGEFFSLILVSLAGITTVALANNLVLLFLALELTSVPTYILIALSRRDLRAQEATGKYFFLGAFAAALTLYGFSFLYGAAGTMQMYGAAASQTSVHAALTASGAMADTFVILGLVLTLAGLSFKIAAVPLHFYVADVYQGAAAPVAGLLGFVPKFAGFVALIRVFGLCDWSYASPDAAAVGHDALFWLLWVLAALTMTLGNTLALLQHNVKRLLAYSSIAHSGYMLVALVAGVGLVKAVSPGALPGGLAALFFYAAVYGVMNLGAFAAVAFFRKPGPDDADDSVEMLDDLAGAAQRHPWASLALAVCILGLMGFPLTAGFLGKFYIFSAAFAAGAPPSAFAEPGAAAGAARQTAMVALVVIGVINAAVGAAYYLRVLGTCYLRRPAAGIIPSRCWGLKISMALCALIVLLLFFLPGLLFSRSKAAAGPQPPSAANVVVPRPPR